MSDRGMKKWAPFASLIEQSTYLEKMHYEKNKKEKPQMSSERAMEINNILSNYHGEEVVVSYYYDGYVYSINKTIKRIDKTNKKLHFEDGYIPFSEIVDIKLKDNNDFF